MYCPAGETPIRVPVPPGPRHIRAPARGQAAAPPVPVDMRLLREILLRGAPPRHALRPEAQEPD